MSLCRKELGEVLIHPSGYLMMLASSKRSQQAAISFRIFPDFLQSFTNILAQLCQAAFILKLLIDPDIPFIIRQPT